MAEEAIFCSYEGASFPAKEFQHYEKYGQVHEHPPDGAPRHTTSGQLLPDEKGAVSTWSIPSKSYRS